MASFAAGAARCRLCSFDRIERARRCTIAISSLPTPAKNIRKHRCAVAQNSQQEPSESRPSPKSDDSPDPNNKPNPIVARLQSMSKAVSKALTSGSSDQEGPAWQAYLLRYGLLALFFLTVGRECMVAQTRRAPQEVLYSDFISLVDAGNVQSARLETASCRLFFDVKPDVPAESVAAASAAVSAADVEASTSVATTSAQSAPAADELAAKFRARTAKTFYVKLADKSDNFLVPYIVKAGVDFGIIKASFSTSLAQIFLAALSLWLPLIPLFFIVRRFMEARNAPRKSKRSTSYERVTFKDVAGVEEAKRELMEVVECLKDSGRYTKLQAKMPSGVLLSGPPGTGKTLLARAVAGEAGVPFLAVSASEFVEMFVGRGAARIRELFAEARRSAPCVVFIDELDAVGGIRGRGWNDERDQTLNQLLTELDGFEGRNGVMLLAATNRVDVLDPALLRPGRISRKVVVPLPDEEGRTEILGVHLRNIPMAEGEDKTDACRIIARVAAGFSGAELANVVNEAALLSARKSQDYVTIRELLEGVRRTKFGVNGRSQASTPDLLQRLQGWLVSKSATPRPMGSASA